MTRLLKLWSMFCEWLQSPSPSPACNPFYEERELRHTIRVNLEILDGELRELKRIARKSSATPNVTLAKSLLEQASQASLLDFGLFALSDKDHGELGEILGQVFAAMRKTAEARRLLNACHAV